MTAPNGPLADELLTSWYARQRRSRRGRTLSAPKAVRDSKGDWRHPDIRPTRAWLRATADSLDVSASHLFEHSIGRQYPALPLDFLTWLYQPHPADYAEYIATPRLDISWCSRCLAEGFANGEPAYIRRQWVLAASGFCHRHHWPLEDRCNACGSLDWRFAAPARGPLRMICNACWRPLERASVSTLDAEKAARVCWDHVIAFEQQLMGAMAGKTPDQFRFNFTSASQLLEQVRDICSLLTRAPLGHDCWGCRTRAIGLNDIACDAMTPGRRGDRFLSYDAPSPLATASPLLRRCLLAAAYAIVDPDPGTSAALFGPDAPLAIDIFVSGMNRELLDSYPAGTRHWSPTFIRQFGAAKQRKMSRSTIVRYQMSFALNAAFA
ncbi:TniQ family protein [Sphingobium sp.]|uniref:TniQ family protein n=1 Tax=Sphingobium sp. TaxID=1912891 RepID=UPI0028BDBDB7|nr:TniQ family protein [Sphingobium sp.]